MRGKCPEGALKHLEEILLSLLTHRSDRISGDSVFSPAADIEAVKWH